MRRVFGPSRLGVKNCLRCGRASPGQTAAQRANFAFKMFSLLNELRYSRSKLCK